MTRYIFESSSGWNISLSQSMEPSQWPEFSLTQRRSACQHIGIVYPGLFRRAKRRLPQKDLWQGFREQRQNDVKKKRYTRAGRCCLCLVITLRPPNPPPVPPLSIAVSPGRRPAAPVPAAAPGEAQGGFCRVESGQPGPQRTACPRALA